MAYVKCIRNLISSTVPDGKTVTPTDDISIWLACGGRSETYTTLSQVLADSACLSALINDNNAVDYLVRSTTWASSITADSSAMSYIGLNNYASNTLLADSTWCSAICNSTYFESVLNVKVPVMTGDTTPSGSITTSTALNTTSYPRYAPVGATANATFFFNKYSNDCVGEWWQYEFTTACKIYLASLISWFSGTHSGTATIVWTIAGSNDNTSFTDIADISTIMGDTKNESFLNDTAYKYYRITIKSVTGGTGSNLMGLRQPLQFYGRADI